MSFDLAAIRAGLADTLAMELTGFEVYRAVGANYDPPCVMVGSPLEIDYHSTMCLVQCDLLVRVVAVGHDPEEAAALMDAVLSTGGTNSLIDIIDNADGQWEQVYVAGAGDVLLVTQGDTEVATVDLTVRIHS